ncbi:MAG: NAD(P)H-dependent oxidoreductase subunit E [Actinomycetota bacterium]|nr:NAD(P)H-dependent oxidoreductase subunit E [Actinomycetota bacterium]
MDLHFLSAKPTDAEKAAVDGLLGPPTSGWEGGDRGSDDWTVTRGGHSARSRRDLLLPALHAVNDRVGWTSQGALNYICQRLSVPPADAYGVASFYALFALHKRPSRVVHLCTDVGCMPRGVTAVREALESSIGHHGEDKDGVVWHESPCLGLCERAPAAWVFEAGDPRREQALAPVTPEQAVAVARGTLTAAEPEPAAEFSVPQAGDPDLVLLRRVGVADPTSLDDYRAHGGYVALRNALALGPAGVIREVTDAKLVGRGGAAFPTGRKWDAVARMPDDPHYLVCNADESEPGTFKDRVIMEGDPYALIEAMTVAGYATGCVRGYLYIRGEYSRATQRLQHAIDEARARGFLGENIFDKGYNFEIEIRRGAGAYICGEETAIFSSIEGLRGEPRTKPPFPVERGLFNKPTLVNNVETLVNVLPILTMGGPGYAAIGTAGSTGPKLFCVSGSVQRPGCYEMPFGATLRELMELAGMPERPLKTVLMGGAAGSFVRGDELDIPLTFEGTRDAGTTLGSGVVLALDDSVDMGDILLRIAGFFRDESCGQCVPCRVGTVRQEEALARITAGKTLGTPADDLALLREVGQVMKDASICGLGQTAWSAVESAIDRLRVFEESK